MSRWSTVLPTLLVPTLGLVLASREGLRLLRRRWFAKQIARAGGGILSQPGDASEDPAYQVAYLLAGRGWRPQHVDRLVSLYPGGADDLRTVTAIRLILLDAAMGQWLGRTPEQQIDWAQALVPRDGPLLATMTVRQPALGGHRLGRLAAWDEAAPPGHGALAFAAGLTVAEVRARVSSDTFDVEVLRAMAALRGRPVLP